MPAVLAHICNPDTEEDEAEGSQLRNSLDYTTRSSLKLIVIIIITMFLNFSIWQFYFSKLNLSMIFLKK